MSSEINVQNVWEVLYRPSSELTDVQQRRRGLIGLRDVHEIHVNLYNSPVYHRRWVDAVSLMIIGRSWKGSFFHLFYFIALPIYTEHSSYELSRAIFACVRRQLKAHS